MPPTAACRRNLPITPHRALERANAAIIWGVPDRARGTIDAALGRAADRIRRQVKPATAADARHAVTHYEVIERFCERPQTGTACQPRPLPAGDRPHPPDPRPHGPNRPSAARRRRLWRGLPDPGQPAAGGPRAGSPTASAGRPCTLSCWPSNTPQPCSLMRFEAPLPADMAGLIEALRRDE